MPVTLASMEAYPGEPQVPSQPGTQSGILTLKKQNTVN